MMAAIVPLFDIVFIGIILERNRIIKNNSTVRLPIRCYSVLSRNLSLVFSLTSTRKVLWDVIIQGKTRQIRFVERSYLSITEEII